MGNGVVNDIDLKNWKNYPDILTDSLWIIDKRDQKNGHTNSVHGNFIPQIPNQLLRRFTKPGERVLDPFAGGGTTLIEGSSLGRYVVGFDIDPKAVSTFNAKFPDLYKCKMFVRDSSDYSRCVIPKDYFDFIIYHPPYHDIIKFTDIENDLSNCKDVNVFIELFGRVLDNTLPSLNPNRFCALVIGDIYKKNEWISLGFLTSQEFTKRGMKLKATIVKNVGETRGKSNQRALWRYRALKNNTYTFGYEYIFVFQNFFPKALKNIKRKKC